MLERMALAEGREFVDAETTRSALDAWFTAAGAAGLRPATVSTYRGHLAVVPKGLHDDDLNEFTLRPFFAEYREGCFPHYGPLRLHVLKDSGLAWS